METRFLESFVAVADHGSISDAARRLGVTAAAVSQRIRALEIELGSTLVARSGRTVRPTEAGAAILAKARALVAQAHDLKVSTDGSPAGQFRLGAIPTALTGMVPRALVALAVTHPRIETVLAPGTSPELYERVLGSDLEAGLLVRPRFELPKTLGWRTLRTEPFVVLASRDLAQSDPRKLLAEQPFIRMHDNWMSGMVGDYLSAHGIRTKDRYEIDSLEAIAVLVDRGLGVSLVPDWAPPWPEGLKLRKLTLPGGPAREIGLAWLRASPRIRLIRAFLDATARPLPAARRSSSRPSRR